MLAPGLFIDRYELVGSIGTGGMAQVWAARPRGQHGFEPLVALKIIHSRFAENPTFRAMFLDEARVVRHLRHPNVAQMLDLGEASGSLFLVMEYVDGESLAALTLPERTVPIPIALRIVADACAGLAAVHALTDADGRPRRIVHRDVSPQNILISTRGDVKVIDFGIAHARDRTAAATELGTVKGKIQYMAPEQARHEELGPFTDVFATGAVLFRMLAGTAPYGAPSDIATLQLLLANAPPAHELPPWIPPDVVAITRRALASDPRERYPDTSALKEDIERLLARESRAPDVAGWIRASLPEQTRQRHAALAAQLGFSPPDKQLPKTAPMPAAPAPPATPEVLASVDAGSTVEVPDLGPPKFMDVNALVARARAGSGDASREAPSPAPEPGAAPPTPPSIELAYTPRRAPAPPAGWGLTVRRMIALAGILAVVALSLLLTPMVVRDRAIAAAREAGLDVTIEKVGVGFGGFTFRNVHAKVLRTPGVTATIKEVQAVGLGGKDLRLLGAALSLEGEPIDLQIALGAVLADQRRRFAGTTSAPRRLTVARGTLRWMGALGAASTVEANDVSLEVETRGAGLEDVRAAFGDVSIRTETATFGPWAFSVDSTPPSSRVRLVLDPPVNDGPSILYVWGPGTTTELTVRVPRAPFTHLGFKPEDLGLLPEATTEVEVKISGRFPEHARSEVKGELSLWKARMKAFATPVDVHVDGSLGGMPEKPLDFDKTIATLGPFTAGVSGTITRHPRGLRIDALFKTLPLTCERLARAEAKTLGTVAALLQDLGQKTNALRVTGTVNASGVVKYDSAAPEDASVTWLAKETCGLSIFGL